MAKKSASSKGYRTYAKKKAYMTKKEWVLVTVVLVLLVVGITVAVTVNFDGALRVQGGVVQAQGDNALVVRGGTNGHPRYYQVGNLGELPTGWTLRENAEGNAYADNYTVDLDAEAADSVVYIAVNQPYELYAQNMILYYGTLGEDVRVSTIGEPFALNDSALAFLYDYHYEVAEETEESEESEATEEAQNAYVRMLNGYYKLSDSRALAISVKKESDNAETLPTQEDMLKILEEAYACVQPQ